MATDILTVAFAEDILDDYVYLILEDNGNPNLDVEESVGILSGVLQPNNKLTWSYLLENYHRHDREYVAGELNGSYTTFKSVKPYKKQEEIVLKFDCSTFQDLDFARRMVKTNCSFGIVDSFTIRPKECEIAFQTKIY